MREYLVKVQVPIPKRIKIGPITVDYKIDLSSLENGLKGLGNEKDNVLNKEIQRLSKCEMTFTSFEYDFVTFPVSSLDSFFGRWCQ